MLQVTSSMDGMKDIKLGIEFVTKKILEELFITPLSSVSHPNMNLKVQLDLI